MVQRKNKISQERLKVLVTYDEKTGVFTWNTTLGSRARAGGAAGGIDTSTGYHQIRLDKRLYYAHRLAWLYVHGYFPEHEIDHINRDKTDNSISNLREVSRGCNAINAGLRPNNTSGVNGVCWYRGAWNAEIRYKNRRIYLGRSKDIIEAAALRLCAEQCLSWENYSGESTAQVLIKQYREGR